MTQNRRPPENDYLRLADEVRDALAAGLPVVALESTVIAHGLPRPDNLSVAREMEAAVRADGAVPATVALMDGRVVVGLSDAELERLATTDEPVAKASRRGLAVALAQKSLAATTVAGTLACAALAGIRIFATGGVGGVHRGAAQTFDISSGLRVPFRAESPADIAAIARAQWESGLDGGLLVACPIPEADALPESAFADALAQAERDADEAHISGPAITPFVLARIATLTGGASVAANRALLLNNAAWAARIAAALVTD